MQGKVSSPEECRCCSGADPGFSDGKDVGL